MSNRLSFYSNIHATKWMGEQLQLLKNIGVSEKEKEFEKKVKFLEERSRLSE